MKFRNILMSAALLAGSLTATAQEAKTEYTYIPNWYIGAQVGGQYTVGEVGFSDLLSPNAQIVVGHNFNSVLGLRLAANAWQSKGGSEARFYGQDYNWKWNYVAPGLDLTVNLSNLIAGYNPCRIVNVGVFAGAGANIAFKNDEAQAVNAAWVKNNQNMSHLWDGTKVLPVGRLGLNVDFKVCKNLALGIEANANFLNDQYNSKHAENADWYFNALVGFKYTLGKTHTKKEVKAPEPIVVEKIVEKIVEKRVPVETKAVVERDPLRIDVFFLISSTKLTGAEGLKIQEIVKYLNKYKDAKVSVTGYADKGTGSAAGNKRLSEKRAAIVVEELVKAGIDPSRITSDSKGDTVQPFDINDLNRVTICIAE